MAAKTEVKKIKAFPFPITIKVGTHTVSAQVVKLNHTGLMVETTSGLLGVGDKVDMEFTFPVQKQVVICSGVAIKFYNQVGAGIRIAEIHFKGLTDANRERISNYLTAVGMDT